jgi:hypothetical protein
MFSVNCPLNVNLTDTKKLAAHYYSSTEIYAFQREYEYLRYRVTKSNACILDICIWFNYTEYERKMA